MPTGPRPLLLDEDRRGTFYCLFLVAAISVLDVVWTLLAHQAGAISKLNSFGARFIKDPHHLVAFKFLLSLLAVGILRLTHRSEVSKRGA